MQLSVLSCPIAIPLSVPYRFLLGQQLMDFMRRLNVITSTGIWKYSFIYKPMSTFASTRTRGLNHRYQPPLCRRLNLLQTIRDLSMHTKNCIQRVEVAGWVYLCLHVRIWSMIGQPETCLYHLETYGNRACGYRNIMQVMRNTIRCMVYWGHFPVWAHFPDQPWQQRCNPTVPNRRQVNDARGLQSN